MSKLIAPSMVSQKASVLQEQTLCDTVTYNKNTCLVFVPISGRVPKTLEFLSDESNKGVLIFITRALTILESVNEVTFGSPVRM